MKLEYMLTLDDAKAAERLHIRQRISRRIGYGFLYWGIPSLAILSLVGFYALGIGRRGDSSLGYSMIVVMLIFLTISIPRDRSKRLRRSVYQKGAQGELTQRRSIEISDARISAEIPGALKTDFEWGVIAQVVHDEFVTLIYLGNKEFILVPTRIFSPAQRTELNDLVARHVPARKP